MEHRPVDDGVSKLLGRSDIFSHERYLCLLRSATSDRTAGRSRMAGSLVGGSWLQHGSDFVSHLERLVHFLAIEKLAAFDTGCITGGVNDAVIAVCRSGNGGSAIIGVVWPIVVAIIYEPVSARMSAER